MKYEEIKDALLTASQPPREVLEALSALVKDDPKSAEPLVSIVADRVFDPKK
jgi:hypothetical protein